MWYGIFQQKKIIRVSKKSLQKYEIFRIFYYCFFILKKVVCTRKDRKKTQTNNWRENWITLLSGVFNSNSNMTVPYKQRMRQLHERNRSFKPRKVLRHIQLSKPNVFLLVVKTDVVISSRQIHLNPLVGRFEQFRKRFGGLAKLFVIPELTLAGQVAQHEHHVGPVQSQGCTESLYHLMVAPGPLQPVLAGGRPMGVCENQCRHWSFARRRGVQFWGFALKTKQRKREAKKKVNLSIGKL